MTTRILGIETSCDDTGIAVLEVENKKLNILSNVIASQIDVHQKYGGVYPSLAKREHEKNLPITLKKALVNIDLKSIHAVAVTFGPGLSPCLWTGVNFAKELAKKWNVPLIPVDHIEAHLLMSLLDHEKSIFPAIALIVSGGHTQLILVKGIGKYKIIGETRDDAAGECFDKTARTLGLEYPGGPAIAREAEKVKSHNSLLKLRLPRPMMHTKDYDFSFSGLKTAVLYYHQAQSKKVQNSKKYIQEMAAEIQQAIIDVLVFKTLKAAREYKTKTVILGGGVAANTELRKQLGEKIQLIAPSPKLSTDNGAMIAVVGYYNWLAKKYTKDYESVETDPNARIA
ncbi:tRNA (adenosine(37)-N6)-threonylcarbamoyltransferase complex transferase subunit TsaD [Patescibacteria group bacterium]|nr:tRNA (adenosine(37)-N6)-threonylcarbamoyltransferase complex transferase subunit TsaD [Patescibacteria group bacterium]